MEKIVICDLDGTLSLFEKTDKTKPHYRNPYDASTCDNDLLNEVVAGLLFGRKVVLCSGREDKFREPTERFLKKHGIVYEKLLMRKSGDYRKDSIIKEEIYTKRQEKG